MSVGSPGLVAVEGKNSRLSRSPGVNFGFGTNAPSSYGCAGSLTSTARRPPEYHVISARSGNNVGLCELNVPFFCPQFAGSFTDQGKLGNVNAIAILAAATGKSMNEVGTTTFRPYYTPVSFGALAGPFIGHHFQPVRRTPNGQPCPAFA